MKRFTAVLALVAACVFHQVSLAQSALGQLEQQLPGGAAAPAIGAAEAPARGYLGADFDEEMNQGKGVLVTQIRAGSAAESGGLKKGDLITSINGRSVKTLDDYDAVAGGPPGTRLQMMVDRGGRLQPLTITLGTRPATPPGAAAASPATSEPSLSAPSLSPPSTSPGSVPGSEPSSPGAFAPGSLTPDASTPSTLPAAGTPGSSAGGIRAQPLDLGPPPPSTIGDEAPASTPSGAATGGPPAGGPSIGISVKQLTDQERVQAGIPVRRGALIAAVKPGGPADQVGLPVGGLIVRFDGRAIESDADLINAVKASQPGQEVEISYYEGSRLGRKSLRLAPSGGAAAPGSAVPPPSYGTLPGAGAGGRSLMSRVDDVQPRPAATTTVWNPLAMAELQSQVGQLTDTIRMLEERIRALEGKSGSSGSSMRSSVPPPSFGSPALPSSGSPALSPPGSVPPTGAGLETPRLSPITNP